MSLSYSKIAITSCLLFSASLMAEEATTVSSSSSLNSECQAFATLNANWPEETEKWTNACLEELTRLNDAPISMTDMSYNY